MRRLRLQIAAALAASFGMMAGELAAEKPPALRVRGAQIVRADTGAPVLLRGIGLGNWLLPEGYMWRLEGATAEWQIRGLVRELLGPAGARAFWRAWEDSYITEEDFRHLRAIGCNSVRVPFNFKRLSPEEHPDVWLERGFEMLDRAVEWGARQGLWVVLDMHAAPGGQTGANIDDSAGFPWLFHSAESQERWVEIWRRLARRYRGNPTVAGMDLINEPLTHYAPYTEERRALEPLYRRATAAIRAEDPERLVIVEGARWSTDFSVFGDPWAPGLIYQFHKYWMPPERREIASYLDFRKRHDVPIWMGESGENTAGWIRRFRELLEAEDIGWAFWTYKRMATDRSARSFPAPEGWSAIQAYAKNRQGTVNNLRKILPDRERSAATLNALLRSVRFANTTENPTYIHALGLRPETPGATPEPTLDGAAMGGTPPAP